MVWPHPSTYRSSSTHPTERTTRLPQPGESSGSASRRANTALGARYPCRRNHDRKEKRVNDNSMIIPDVHAETMTTARASTVTPPALAQPLLPNVGV